MRCSAVGRGNGADIMVMLLRPESVMRVSEGAGTRPDRQTVHRGSSVLQHVLLYTDTDGLTLTKGLAHRTFDIYIYIYNVTILQ